jgi:hypothetical protein
VKGLLRKMVGRSKEDQADPFVECAVYRMQRDALMIAVNLNRGRNTPTDEIKRQLVFFQWRLCSAAVADPQVPQGIKAALLSYQIATQRANIMDRRGQKRRSFAVELETVEKEEGRYG